MFLDGGTILGGDTRFAHHGVQIVQAAEGVEVALADLAGVGDQIARVCLAKSELLDTALVHVGRRYVTVQDAVGADKRRIDAQRTQGILSRWPHKSGCAATVHTAHEAQVAVFARLEQVKDRKRIGHDAQAKRRQHRGHLLNRSARAQKDGRAFLDKLHGAVRNLQFFLGMLGALFAVRILMAQHSVWTALRTTGSTVHALDLAQARKFLKVATDRHVRDAQRVRNLLDRNRSLFLEQLTNLILSLRFNHDESSPFFAHISFKQ